jgi:hypothetical protein
MVKEMERWGSTYLGKFLSSERCSSIQAKQLIYSLNDQIVLFGTKLNSSFMDLTSQTSRWRRRNQCGQKYDRCAHLSRLKRPQVGMLVTPPP